MVAAGAFGNPIDVIGDASPELYAKALEIAGRYSLGLFALHKYAWYAIAGALGASFLAAHANTGPMLVAGLTVVVSCAVIGLVLLTPAYTLVGGVSKSKLAKPGHDELDAAALKAEPDPLPPV